MSGLTASQTVGPFFHSALLRSDAERQVLVTDATAGERIRIEGRVLDGDGQGVPDAMVEIWQANSHGRYDHPVDQRPLPLDEGFVGYGRSGTDADGWFWFETVRPGRVPFDEERMQAAHVNVAVFARGLLNHLLTRLYFADDPATGDDPVLARVPEERRATLLATRRSGGEGTTYEMDIVLQGTDETVFFNL